MYNQFNYQAMNNCFASGPEPANLNSVFGYQNQSSFHGSLSFRSSGGALYAQRYDQPNAINRVFSARGYLDQARSFDHRDRSYSRGTSSRQRYGSHLDRNHPNLSFGYSSDGIALSEIVDQHSRRHRRDNLDGPFTTSMRGLDYICDNNDERGNLRFSQFWGYTSHGAIVNNGRDRRSSRASRRRRRSASPLAADHYRNQRNRPLGNTSDGAALHYIVDYSTNNNSRNTDWTRHSNSSPFASNRNHSQQPLVYTAEGAALDAAVDELERIASLDASIHRKSSNPFVVDHDLDQPSLPWACNSDGAIVDQCFQNNLRNTNQPNNHRGSNGPFASNRIRGQQPLVYTAEGAALDAAIDELVRIASYEASRHQRSISPFAYDLNCNHPSQPLVHNSDAAALYAIDGHRSQNTNWHQTDDRRGSGHPLSASERKDKGVLLNVSEQTSESESSTLAREFEQAGEDQSGGVSSTFSTRQKGKQRETYPNELHLNESRSAVQSDIQSDNDQLGNAPEDVSFIRQVEPEETKSTQASVPEVSSLNRQQEPKVKNITANMAAQRAQRFGGTNKTEMYQQYKTNRIQERQLAIKNGLIPDPNIPVRLEDAIDFRGTCEGMCSDFEVIERQIQNNVDSLERDEAKNVDPEKMVKAYRRSAAGNEQQLPSDVRTPKALITTLDYLINKVLAQYPLDKCHAFIRDRTRSIRQDFTVQNIRDLHAIQVHERVARFHILCLHELCEQEESKFSAQQETEQLQKVLLSLMEFYDDLREEEEIETPNEAEFRAYYYITHMRDQDIARQAQTLPINIFRDPCIQRALQFIAFAQRNNEIPESSSRRNKPENVEACQNFYSKFFDLIADENTPFLMACLLECSFADVRKGALKAMNLSHMIKAGGVPAEEVRRVLKYDTLAQLLKEANLYGIIIDMSLGQPTLCFGQKHYKAKTKVFVEPLSNPSQTKSLSLVEPKRQGRSFQDIVNNIDSSSSLPDDDFDSPLSNQRYNQDDQYEKTEQQEQNMYVARSAQTKKRQLLEETRLKADAAEACAANERQKLQALIEKKQKEAQMKKEKEEQLEKVRLLKEKLMKEEQERRLQEEKEDELRQERERQEKLLINQENLRQAEILRERARSAQILDTVMKDIADAVLDEEIRVAIIKMKRVRKNMKKAMSPRLAIARGRITKRNKEASSKQERYQFGQYIATHNPYSTILKQKLLDYRHQHSSSEEIDQRVQLSIDFDELVSEDLDELSRSEKEVNESVWVKQAFAENIFRRVYDKVMHDNKQNHKDYKTEWQLFISTPEKSGTTYDWYKQKFDLDDDFCRKVERYKQFDVAMRIVTPKTEFGAKWALGAGAIIFDLPNTGLIRNEEDEQLYWAECRKRLEDLTKKIQKYSSRKVPILFTYFSGQADTKMTLTQIPKILDLGKNPMVKDYHFLIVNPKTVVVRIVDEINWLANHSE